MAKAKRKVDYNSVFAVRLRECMDKQGVTQKELADYIGKTRQAVNFYTLGETVPDADALILISKRLDVSVDYLLGLSDAATLNTSTQDIHHITGLSERAIDTLVKINSPVYLLDGYDKKWLTTINFLIETAVTELPNDLIKLGILSALSEYYSAFSSDNKQVLFALSTGKVFTDYEEAEKEVDRIMENDITVESVSISKIEAHELLDNMLTNRLLKRIEVSRNDFLSTHR